MLYSALELRVNRFQITLDGPDICHDTTRKTKRGGKTYGTIIHNLKGMHQRTEEFRVTIRINFNESSVPIMDPLFTELRDIFGHDQRFSFHFRPIGRWGGTRDSSLAVCHPSRAKVVGIGLSEAFLDYGSLDKVVTTNLQLNGNVCYTAND